MSDTVGVVGLGNMGGAIARSLLRGGIPILAWDTSSEALAALVSDGAIAADSLADLGRRCQVIMIVVVTDDQVRQVTDELLTVAAPGSCLVVQSTVRPTTVIDLAGLAAEHGIGVVDAGCGGGGNWPSRGASPCSSGVRTTRLSGACRCSRRSANTASTSGHRGPARRPSW